MIYMVTYIPLIFPASWYLEKKVRREGGLSLILVPLQLRPPHPRLRPRCYRFSGPAKSGFDRFVRVDDRGLDQVRVDLTRSVLGVLPRPGDLGDVPDLHPGDSTQAGCGLVQR